MKTMHIGSADEHPFLTAPNKTLIQLAVPVLFALVAEPLTGLADTAFVARLPGSEPVAALGIGTVAFSSIFWAFSFLGIGTQTEIAQAVGRGAHGQAIKVVSLAALLAACIGCALMLLAYPALDMSFRGYWGHRGRSVFCPGNICCIACLERLPCLLSSPVSAHSEACRICAPRCMLRSVSTC